MTTDFVHLNVHSEFSIKDGIIRIPDLLATAKEYKQSSVAITDICNLFGLVKFYQKAISLTVTHVVG